MNTLSRAPWKATAALSCTQLFSYKRNSISLLSL